MFWANTIGTRLAKAHFDEPDVDFWIDQLKQPDNPGASCCGGHDAYYADKTDECGPGDYIPALYGGCALVAIITDTREITGRHPFAVGTRIPVPRSKIRTHYSPNPTDHNIIFVGPQKQVYCFEPTPLL
jgi:hypothetical protein